MAVARLNSHKTERRSHSTSLLPTPKKTLVMAKEGGKRPKGEKQRVIGLHQHSGLSTSFCSGHSAQKYRYPKPRSRRHCIFPLSIHLPANDMPNDLQLGRANKNSVYKHPALIDIINKVEPEEKDRDRLHGLVTCAEEFKQTQTQNRSCKCIDIQLLGWFWIFFYTFPISSYATFHSLLRVFIMALPMFISSLHLLFPPPSCTLYKPSLAPSDEIKGYRRIPNRALCCVSCHLLDWSNLSYVCHSCNLGW